LYQERPTRFFLIKLTKSSVGEGKNLQTEHNAWKRQPKIETITTVIDELNERKTRETNLLIFGLKENVSEISQH
jgi:hypothetical protein